jgi:predicted NBD/HSP70 family sugar kinase
VARGTNLEHTREYNRRAVLDVLRRAPLTSRTEVAGRTGLSLSAVSNLMEALVQEGLVVSRGRRSTPRGQPPVDYELAPDGAFGIGVSLDRDHATAALVDLAGTLLAKQHITLSAPTVPDAAAVVAELATGLLASLSRGERGRVAGLGVAVPGVMDRDGRVVRMVRLLQWEGADLVAECSRASGLPTTVTNDAIAAAVGASSYGAGRRIDTFFYVLFALGLGSTLIMHGRPHRGLWGLTGRLGHIPVDPHGPPCPACGGSGCLSLYASVEALADALRPHGSATGSLDDELAAIASRFAEGDPVVESWLETAATALARGLAVLENLLDPDAVILDGRMPSDVLAALVERTETRYRERRVGRADAHRLRLVVGGLGRDAAAYGAASVPLYAATAVDLELVR